ncbi:MULTISPECIES: hypothetical protein [unclassified Pseudovibrio]|uniref:hypothetical protein n=1 Tax=unclassified Pseudovibrio TaxID=2627060 RepID=UPI0007AE4A81|nr:MULTISPECIES: hypothetical protein [unclassified Pseudovibrio]KZL02540.1 hypothetical protein PsW74_01643 [Pseudovibrio sp. W74]KZL07917.1 hypothetical protein PsAD14_03059 [Pseudovibrio sp. Ad14]
MSGLTIGNSSNFHGAVENLVNQARVEHATSLNLNTDDLIVSIGSKKGNPQTGERIYSVVVDTPQHKRGLGDNLKSAASALSHGRLANVKQSLSDATKNIGNLLGRTQSAPEQAKENWAPFLELAEQTIADTIKHASSGTERLVDLKAMMAGIQASVFDRTEFNEHDGSHRTLGDATKVDIRSLKAMDAAVSSAQSRILGYASSTRSAEGSGVQQSPLYDVPRQPPQPLYDTPRPQPHQYDTPRPQHPYDHLEPKTTVAPTYAQLNTGTVYQNVEAQNLGENTESYSARRTLEITNGNLGTNFQSLDQLNDFMEGKEAYIDGYMAQLQTTGEFKTFESYFAQFNRPAAHASQQVTPPAESNVNYADLETGPDEDGIEQPEVQTERSTARQSQFVKLDDLVLQKGELRI